MYVQKNCSASQQAGRLPTLIQLRYQINRATNIPAPYFAVIVPRKTAILLDRKRCDSRVMKSQASAWCTSGGGVPSTSCVTVTWHHEPATPLCRHCPFCSLLHESTCNSSQSGATGCYFLVLCCFIVLHRMLRMWCSLNPKNRIEIFHCCNYRRQLRLLKKLKWIPVV